MGLQKVAFNFMVERGGKLAKSLLCSPQKSVTSFKSLKYAPIKTDVFESGVKINLTRELKSTFYKPDKIKEILTNYPHVSRRVGTLPPELAKKLGAGENLEKFDEVLTDFARSFTTKGYGMVATEKEISVLAANLSKILGETVTIIPIGGGKIGYGYKIATKEKNMFFKCFYDLTSKPSLERAGNGNYAEIASALYSQTSAPDKFIKFYMGKFGEKNDGYMLTEFIEGKATHQKPKFCFKELIHKFISGDPNPANKINGRFIDFGMSDPTEFDKMKPLSYKILKKIMVALDDNSAKNLEKIVKKYKGTTEYGEALEKVQDIIRKKFNNNMIEFTSRKDLFKVLELDYKPQLEKLIAQISKNIPPADTKLEEIAKCYGISMAEIKAMYKSSFAQFKNKYANNLISRNAA